MTTTTTGTMTRQEQEALAEFFISLPVTIPDPYMRVKLSKHRWGYHHETPHPTCLMCRYLAQHDAL